MLGKIVVFDTDAFRGVIDAGEGKRYAFAMREWRSAGAPIPGQDVDFEIAGAIARNVVLIVKAPPPAAPEDIAAAYLSFSGRMSRKAFWTRWVLPFGALLVACVLIDLRLGFFDPAVGTLFFPITALAVLFALWPGLSAGVRRCHDRGKSGWYLLLVLIPLAGAVWLFVELGIWRGEREANRFGPDPAATGA